MGSLNDLAEAATANQLDVVVIGGKHFEVVFIDVVERNGSVAVRCRGSLRSVLLATGFRVRFFVNLLDEIVAAVHLAVI